VSILNTLFLNESCVALALCHRVVTEQLAALKTMHIAQLIRCRQIKAVVDFYR